MAEIIGVARQVMEQLAELPDDEPGYNAILIEGATVEEADAAIEQLIRLGFVNGCKVAQGFGPPSNLYLASSLTPAGRRALLSSQ